MINLGINKDKAIHVIQKGGYIAHKDSPIVGGYVKDCSTATTERRWHAKEVKNHLEIHMDTTIGYKHRVLKNPFLEKIERQRLMKIYHELYPKVYKKMKVEYAPNLKEIQKHTLNQKQTFWERIVRIFRKSFPHLSI